MKRFNANCENKFRITCFECGSVDTSIVDLGGEYVQALTIFCEECGCNQLIQFEK